MTWYRLEPNTVDTDVEEGTQARIADPLWLLSRQWQLGEFKGEDAASPIHVRASVLSNAVATFRNGAEASAPTEPFASNQPLECRVEAEEVLDGPAAIALAAEAGVQLLRRLDLAGLGDVRRAVDWPKHFGFDYAAEGLDTSHLPERTQRRLDLLARRGVDGRKLYAQRPADFAHLTPRVSQATADKLRDVFLAWKKEYAGRFREPGPSGDCWVEERMEYAFSLGVRTGGGEVVLAADEYHGGHLDWYAFRVAPELTHDLERRTAKRQDLDLLPQPAMFRGQPASRFWEFEDRTVYFGNLSAGPADVARLVVAEYGAVFSDDWFLVPVTVDIGTLNRVTKLEVLDVFGGVTPIRSAAEIDHDLYPDGRPFRFFELEGDDSAAIGKAPWLFVPPALAGSQNGKPVELVTMLRDEQANLGWAIEQQIELPTGEPMRRRAQWVRGEDTEDAPAVDASTETDTETTAWRYRLQTPVPPWWIPLIPERISESGPEVMLRRSRMQSWSELDPALVGAKGRLVGVARALRIYEEEVPRGGIQVTRAWQRARASDGTVHLWMARKKRPGRGDRGSGLEFDVIER
jgi:hypothetical protein